jgi:hypothetical protein
MRLRIQIPHVPVIIAATLVCVLPAFGGALPPCIKAVSSKNGKFLVVSDMDLGPLNPSNGKASAVQRTSLQIFPKENFINSDQAVTAPATYWTDFLQWSVVLSRSNKDPFLGCPPVLITDDGEFLVILREHAAGSSDPALRIYRRRDHAGDPAREGPDHGIFIKDITLGEIWPPDKFPGALIITDHTPLWFAGGIFEFSADSRVLIHKTPWGNSVRISLIDGSVSRS